MTSKTCNQCEQEMTDSISVMFTMWLTLSDRKDSDTAMVFVCSKPDCPNYGLLQIPAELMPKDNEDGKE